MKWRRKRKVSKEFVSPRQELRESTRISPKELISGGILSRGGVIHQIPFALFLFVMILIYIANQYRGEKIMREIMTIEEQVRELRTKSISTTFQLQLLSKQSHVKKMIQAEALPLKEALIPPYKIIVDD